MTWNSALTPRHKQFVYKLKTCLLHDMVRGRVFFFFYRYEKEKSQRSRQDMPRTPMRQGRTAEERE